MIYVVEKNELGVSSWVANDEKDYINRVEISFFGDDTVIWSKSRGREILDNFGVESLEEARQVYPELNAWWDEMTENGIDNFYYRSFNHPDITATPIPEFETYVDYNGLNIASQHVFLDESEVLDALNDTYLDVEEKAELKEIFDKFNVGRKEELENWLLNAGFKYTYTDEWTDTYDFYGQEDDMKSFISKFDGINGVYVDVSGSTVDITVNTNKALLEDIKELYGQDEIKEEPPSLSDTATKIHQALNEQEPSQDNDKSSLDLR